MRTFLLENKFFYWGKKSQRWQLNLDLIFISQRVLLCNIFNKQLELKSKTKICAVFTGSNSYEAKFDTGRLEGCKLSKQGVVFACLYFMQTFGNFKLGLSLAFLIIFIRYKVCFEVYSPVLSRSVSHLFAFISKKLKNGLHFMIFLSRFIAMMEANVIRFDLREKKIE